MARKNCLNSLKQKFIIILTLLCMVCFTAFTAFACKEDETEKNYNDGTYSISKEDDGIIKNASFAFDVNEKEITAQTFPYTSVPSWTKNTEFSSASMVDSGLVSVTETNWENLMKKLYDDSDFLSYLQKHYQFEDANVKAIVNPDDQDSVTKAQIKEYVVNNLLLGKGEFLDKGLIKDFANPSSHAGATDNYMYMLNNYVSDIGLGTAQKIVSSSTVMLEANKTYKLSVWVKVINPIGQDSVNQNYGANIRLVNNFNSNNQADFRLTGIKANPTAEGTNGWNEYSIYLTTDEYISTSITLQLGLGEGKDTSNNTARFTEGTALFDDISLTIVEDATTIPTFTSDNTAKLSYGKTDLYEYKIDDITKNVYKYEMVYSNFKPAEVTAISDVTSDYTKSNITTGTTPSEITSKNIAPDGSFTQETGTQKYTLANSAGTIFLGKTTNFELAPAVVDSKNYGQLMAISFEIKADLNKLSSTNIAIDVYDIFGGETTKRPAVTTLDNNGEWTKVTIVIKNNFDDQTRKFYVGIVIGPEDIASVKYLNQLTNGTVEFKNFEYIIKPIDADAYIITNEYEDGKDNPSYKITSLYTNLAKSTTALYTGFSEDFNDSEDEKASYAFTSTPSDMGAITSKPTTVDKYDGIVPGHAFLESNSTNYAVNERIGSGTNEGVAGLINSKYVSKYATEIQTALAGAYTAGEDIQPLVIWNKTSNSYGYVGTNQVISASTYAKISVKVRVVGENAKANIYLVDVLSEAKPVMGFADFTVNTDIIAGQNGTAVTKANAQFAFTVTADMMDSTGWATVDFLIATGNVSKEYRVELWNGDREGVNNSEGFVFIDSVAVTASDAFTIPTRWADLFSDSTSPLFNVDRTNMDLYAYQRQLSDNEINFNKEYPDQTVAYEPNIIWAKNDKVIYAVYSALEYTETNPYDGIEVPVEEGCTAETDPSTFWLSFSSIALVVVLVLAILVIFIKNLRRRRRKYAHDARENFKIKSRAEAHRSNQEKLQKGNDENLQKDEDEITTEEEVVQNEEPTQNKPAEEQNLDDYVYGDVQSFGEDQPKADGENTDDNNANGEGDNN